MKPNLVSMVVLSVLVRPPSLVAITLNPPYPIPVGSCAGTNADNETIVGGVSDQACNMPGTASSMVQRDNGYSAALASVGIGPAGFGAIATVAIHDHALISYGPIASLSAFAGDSVTIGGGVGSGTFVLPVHVTGSGYIYYTRPASIPDDPTFEAYFKLACWYSETFPAPSCGSLTVNFDVENTENMPTPVDSVVDMQIPFTFGVPTPFIVDIAAYARFFTANDNQGIGAKQDATVSVDFSHTGVVEKGKVLDDLGNEVPDATVDSASGFDYLNPGGAGGTTTTTSITTSTTAGTAPTSSTTTTTTVPQIALRLVAGKTLKLKDNPKPTKRSATIVAADASFTVAGLDPTQGGAEVRLFGPDTGERDAWPLPQAGWRVKGKRAKRIFKYVDKARVNGPVTAAALADGKIAVTASGAGIGYTLRGTGPQHEIAMAIVFPRSSPTQAACAEFPGTMGTVAKDDPVKGIFAATKANAPTTCRAL